MSNFFMYLKLNHILTSNLDLFKIKYEIKNMHTIYTLSMAIYFAVLFISFLTLLC